MPEAKPILQMLCWWRKLGATWFHGFEQGVDFIHLRHQDVDEAFNFVSVIRDFF